MLGRYIYWYTKRLGKTVAHMMICVYKPQDVTFEHYIGWSNEICYPFNVLSTFSSQSVTNSYHGNPHRSWIILSDFSSDNWKAHSICAFCFFDPLPIIFFSYSISASQSTVTFKTFSSFQRTTFYNLEIS